MRVFSVEMLVKEEGAATVQAALNRLKQETQAVAADMKMTAQAVTNTGNAMQGAATKTQIAGDRAAKAAIGFAAVGNSLARTGSITADMGTRIVEAGSQISMMFGPSGLAVAALLGFASAAVTSFVRAGNEAKKMAQETQKALREMVLAGDVTQISKRLRDVQDGLLDLTSGEFTGGLDDLRKQYIQLQQTIANTTAADVGRRRTAQESAAQRQRITDLRDLERQIRSLEATERSLLRARELAGRFAPTVAAAAPAAVAAVTPTLAALPTRVPTEVLARINRDFSDLLRVQIPEAIAPAVVDLSNTIYGQLAAGISGAISGGITSGFQMALASGNIGEAFRAMGQAIVSSLASSMVNVALAAIQFGTLMEKIRIFMMANPALAVVSAIALLTLAKAMGGSAQGAGMGAIGTAGGLSYAPIGGGASAPTQLIFGQTSATTAAGMTPRQSMNVTVIGPNDPSAQRAIQELMTKAESRGRIG